MIRVLNVNESLDLKTGGGTAERTFQMSKYLAKHGAQCSVLVLDRGLDQDRIKSIAPVAVTILPPLWRRFGVPKFSVATIRRLVSCTDIVHLMGHWSILNAIVYLVSRQMRVPYVVCPAGALPLFGRSIWLKRIYNAVLGRSIIRNASGWIAVTASELPDFQKYGIPSEMVTILSNGVVDDEFPIAHPKEFLRKFELPEAPIILFMGRLNPIKGPDLLLRAFLKVQQRLDKFHLVFAGPDGGMLTELHELSERGGGGHRVHFLGFLDGAEKSAAYRAAQLLVVPSRQEAMSIVALEAGICGTPALMTDQCGLSEVREVDERLEVSATVDGLASGMLALLTDINSMKPLGSAWRAYVAEKYSWTKIAPRYLSLYNEILDRLKPA